ncbi:MAG: diacylglycerol kinase family protein, partial [Verrucomicrobiaceae bacterium]|nr:diacylglycerol kinase family protein [Verrucomicrobiaceae bacterium]
GAALFAVVTCGFVLQIATWEWCAVILASGVVMAAEIFNTSLEWLADRVSAEREDAIRNVKDAAAGAVLAASVAASVVGAVIFLPKLLAL